MTVILRDGEQHPHIDQQRESISARPAARPVYQAKPTVSPALPTKKDGQSDYLAPDVVDRMAFAIDVPELPIPEDNDVPTGSLKIRILIDELGKANSIQVLETSLPEYYVSILANHFYHAAFSPALLDGSAVKSWRIVEITYDENIKLGDSSR
jgi:hypothetical protein